MAPLNPGTRSHFDPDAFRMPLGDHIEELRRCLVMSIIGMFVAAVVTFYFGFQIISWLAQPVLQVMELRGYPPSMITTDPTAGFGTFMKVSLIAALIVSSPWIIFQGWRFIATGLYAKERKIVYVLTPFSTLMTILAVMFTYYLLLPAGMWFFYGWADKYPEIEYHTPNFFISVLADASGVTSPPTEVFDTEPITLPILADDPTNPQAGNAWIHAPSGKFRYFINGRIQNAAVSPTSMLSPMPELGQYVRFAAMICLGIVVAFQTPVIMLVLGWTGIVDPASLRGARRYAVMACCVAGAALTPNDPITMLILGIPLYTLFEFGLLLMRLVYKPPVPWDPDDPFGMEEAQGNDGDDPTPPSPESPLPKDQQFDIDESGDPTYEDGYHDIQDVDRSVPPNPPNDASASRTPDDVGDTDWHDTDPNGGSPPKD